MNFALLRLFLFFIYGLITVSIFYNWSFLSLFNIFEELFALPIFYIIKSIQKMPREQSFPDDQRDILIESSPPSPM